MAAVLGVSPVYYRPRTALFLDILWVTSIGNTRLFVSRLCDAHCYLTAMPCNIVIMATMQCGLGA